MKFLSADRLFPATLRGRRRLAVLLVGAALCVVFRYHLVTAAAVAHNAVWQIFTGNTEEHHPAGVRLLLFTRAPGRRVLKRWGEYEALAGARDARLLPELIECALTDTDSRAREAALRGVCRFWDERVPDTLATALDDTDPSVRRLAICGIRDFGLVTLLPSLEHRRAHEDDGATRALIDDAVAALRPDATHAERPAPETVRVAAVQFRSVFAAPAENRRRLEPCIREAAAKGAKIVVLPETAISGYASQDLKRTWHAPGWDENRDLAGIEAEGVAERVPGPSTKAFAELAAELGIFLTVPFLEVEPDTGRYFNTTVLVGPEGNGLLHYRKLNPWPYVEKGWASPGDRGHQVIDTPYGRLALLICFDINFEPLALKQLNVDILLYSIAWVDSPKSRWFRHDLPDIARFGNFHIIGANWTVAEKPTWDGYGQSLIIDRTGRVLARVKDDLVEEIIYADLPIERPQRQRQ